LADDSKIDDVCQIVRDILALHAQVPTTPFLSLYARAKSFKREELEAELYTRKNLAKIKCLRQTVFILPRETVAPAFIATERLFRVPPGRYPRYFGITKQEYDSISKTIEGTIRDHGLTTKEIRKRLEGSQNTSVIINHMCDQGILIRGRPSAGWKTNTHTYHTFADYLPDLDLHSLDELGSRALITEEYIKSFGPVSRRDIEWWTGFPKREIQKVLESINDRIKTISMSPNHGDYLISELDVRGMEAFTSQEEPTINLVPALDPFMMGYKERERFVDHKDYDNVFDFNGNATSTILLDGRVIGVWDVPKKKDPIVKICLFAGELDSRIQETISAKAKLIGEFIRDCEVKTKRYDSMIPLTKRSAGGYLSPLKD
jgi:hypothetical protein